MAVIQKIRDKYAKLAGGVIVVALVGFILTDLGKSGPSRSTSIGKINGDKIDVKEYEAAINQRENEVKRQNPNASLDENQIAQLRDQAWSELVASHLMNEVNEKMGITVTKAELTDMLTGADPDPAVRQAFTDPQTGLFNPQQVTAQIAQIKKTADGKAQWDAFEADLIKRRYADKFNGMVSGAIYTPKFILDDMSASRNSLAKIGYVKLPYTLIPDASVPVSDADIKAYMEKHKTMFTVKEATRSLEFVTFPIVPSAEDSARSFGQLDTLKAQFAASTDDEGFVSKNSQDQVPVNYYTKQQLQSLPNVDQIMAAPVNSVVGPFYNGNSFSLAKIEDVKTLPDSVTCRHILVATQPQQQGGAPLSDTAAKVRIDSVVAMVKGGVPFDSLVTRYTDDPGSKTTGGKYDFTLAQRGSIAKEFGDFVFEGKAGESKIVKTTFGYHYIEIIKQAAPTASVKIAFVSKELSVSEGTNDALYSKATQFASQAVNGAAFDKAAKANGLMVSPADGLNRNSYVVNGIGASKDLVKWAYDAKIGDVSSVMTINNKYVVAKVSSSMEAGLAPINEKTRPILADYVRKNKKAEMLIAKSKQGSLEAIAQAQGQTVGVADSVNFLQNFIPGVGNEPKVTGYAFFKSLKENTLSPGIAGQEGVYYITVQGRTTVPETAPRNLQMERQMADYQIKSNAGQQVINGMRESAEVKDTRAELY